MLHALKLIALGVALAFVVFLGILVPLYVTISVAVAIAMASLGYDLIRVGLEMRAQERADHARYLAHRVTVPE